MYPIIEFCQSNLASGSGIVMKELEKQNNMDVIDYGCLGCCGLCAEGPFALVNGEVVTGKNSKELLKNIYQYIEEHADI